MSKEVDLFYCVKNLGDGSVAVKFHANKKLAKKEDENQPEGWGESTVSSVKLKIIDGKIYFRKYGWNENDEFEDRWIELQ